MAPAARLFCSTTAVAEVIVLIDVSSLVRRPAHRQRLLRDEASSSLTTLTPLMLAPLPHLADADD